MEINKALLTSFQLYMEVFKTGERLLKDIYKVFGYEKATATSKNAVALNTLGWERKEIVELSPGEYGIASGQGNLLEIQPLAAVKEPGVTVEEVKKGVFSLKNEQLSVLIEDGLITSLYDRKENRELIPKGGKANQLVIFDDKPLYWQAWDVEVYHLDSRKELPTGETKIVENSAQSVSVMTETKISKNSWIKTIVTLKAALEGVQSYIEVAAEVEWREDCKFLKVEFPVDIRNTEASYETQFGIVRRPTHYNTTWDMAKFEVCCHKFADLSENGYGVSILNDSKYGFATVGNLMRLSLLRAPKAPDAHADMGRHHIRWAILPHQGNLGPTTVRTAFEFNHPMRLLQAVPSKTSSPSASTFMKSPLISLTGNPSLVLDTVKRAEDDSDVTRGELPKRKGRSVVVRVYDSLGGRSEGVIETKGLAALGATKDKKVSVTKAYKTNLLEDDLEEIEVGKDGGVKIVLRPFEVATFRLLLA